MSLVDVYILQTPTIISHNSSILVAVTKGLITNILTVHLHAYIHPNQLNGTLYFLKISLFHNFNIDK